MVKRKVLKPNIIRGGTAVPLGSNYYYMAGRKHSQGGIDVGRDLEVEGGEVMKVSPKEVKVYSSVPFLNGRSPAQKVLGGENPTKVFREQENYKNRNGINDDGTKKGKRKAKLSTEEAIELGKTVGGYLPFIGTALDAYELYKNPSLEQAGWTGLGLASDILTGGIARVAIKTARNAKRAKNTLKFANNNISRRIAKDRAIEAINANNKAIRDAKVSAVGNVAQNYTQNKTQKPMGGLSRSKDYGSKSKPYPSVKSGDFVGGHRSYPIPTKADAVDALRLAGLHGRSDVKAKVYSKYPELRKKAKTGGLYSLTTNDGTVLKPYPSTGESRALARGNKGGKRKKALYGIDDDDIAMEGTIPNITVKGNRKRNNRSISESFNPPILVAPELNGAIFSRRNIITGKPVSLYGDNNIEYKQLDGSKFPVYEVPKNTTPTLEYNSSSSEQLAPSINRELTQSSNNQKRNRDRFVTPDINVGNNKESSVPETKQEISINNNKSKYPERRRNRGDNPTPRLEYSKTLTEHSTPNVYNEQSSENLGTPRAKKRRKHTDSPKLNINVRQPVSIGEPINTTLTPPTLKNPIKTTPNGPAKISEINKPTPNINTDTSNLTKIAKEASEKGKPRNWWQRTTNKIGQAIKNDSSIVGDAVSAGANLIGSIVSNRLNSSMLDKLHYSPAPIPQVARKLKTRININPQLDAMRESLADYERNVDANTGSSQVALARKQRAQLTNTLQRNALYANKENQETELINKDRLNQQGVANSNIAAYNKWTENKQNFENTIAEKKAENNVGLVQNIAGLIQNTISNREKRASEDKTLAALSFGSANLPIELFYNQGIVNKRVRDAYRKAYPLKTK